MGRRALTEDEKSRGRALIQVLRETREKQQLTAEELAEAAGVKLDTLRRIEQMKTFNPGFFTVAELSVALNISLEDLLRLTERRLRRRSN